MILPRTWPLSVSGRLTERGREEGSTKLCLASQTGRHRKRQKCQSANDVSCLGSLSDAPGSRSCVGNGGRWISVSTPKGRVTTAAGARVSTGGAQYQVLENPGG